MSTFKSEIKPDSNLESNSDVTLTQTSKRFSPEEESTLLTECNSLKASANSLFAQSCYEEAIQGYDKALASCPNYLDYEIAVLRSNISACHLKLEDWKAAVDSTTEALECLDRIDPPPKLEKEEGEGNGQVEEVDEETAERIEALNKGGRSRDDVQKLRAKVLLRRARAREGVGGWAALQGANEDYNLLLTLPLSPLDRKTVQRALTTLPPKLETAKQKEMGDMMGKLKQLGNGILKPFGLSTDNFQMVKDEKTGGYSVQFNQNR